MTAGPAHLSPAARAAWVELQGDRDLARMPAAAQEAYAVCVARMRDAQARIDAEGMVVADEKGRPVAHPCLAIERACAAELRAWKRR